MRFSHIVAGSLLFVLAAITSLPGRADDNIYTQQPEVATAREVGKADAAPVAEKPASTAALFKEGPVPQWIWGADPNGRYVLKKTFAGGSKTAQLKASCDNIMTLSLNGQRVASSDTWENPVEVDVQQYIKPGENVLTAEVANAGGPSGFVLKLALTAGNGQTTYVVSDASWQAAVSADAKQFAAVRTLGKLGTGPWKDVFSVAAVGAAGPRDVFNVLPGFQVERLFTVPKEKLGSWVSITTDERGRLIASDQGGLGLCRITPPRIGSSEPTKVEHLDVKITAAQGMLYAFGSLYLSVNGGPGSGLYRARDTNGDDQYDEVVKLASLRGGGEHGPHALRLSPDGKSIYLVCGNHTDPPEKIDASRLPTNWGEDLLLPRQWDANGHARGRLAPGGWIAKTDPDGKTWEIVSIGYRNTYDMDFNADGELFAYDADMEWDMGSPWYRPTRVVHATSGSEFGWRSGTGKWPTYYLDSLPPLVDIGPGSPVGATFGYGTRFPARYQKALYICDWTFGTMYAIHIEPEGASYRATKEEFVSRTPLPLTDVVVGKDGALYFTIGGRGAQSELFRVTYVGNEPIDPVDTHDGQFAELRKLRHQIEAYHRRADDPAAAVAMLWPHLGHADRHIRYAARVALEHQPVEQWQSRVLGETDPETLLTASVALARQGAAEVEPSLLQALDRLKFEELSPPQQLELLRVYQLVMIRLGEPDDAARLRLAEKLGAFYPAKSDAMNRELATLLVYLRSPDVVHKTIPLLLKERPADDVDFDDLLARNRGYGGTIATILANQPDAEQMYLALVLRNAREGWTLDERVAYFQWFDKAHRWSGGASFQGFLRNIEQEAYENATDMERLAVEALGARKPYVPPPLPKPQGPGRAWTFNDLIALGQSKLKGRDFKNGQKMFAAARCVVCHRFASDGGATGPDLTQLAGRFNLKDLSEAIVDPSKVVSDRYRASIVVSTSGKVYTGQIVTKSKEALTILLDPENPTKVEEIRKSDIEEQKPSTVSMMPKDLLAPLNEDEVLDLLAYLLSRGNPQDDLFKK